MFVQCPAWQAGLGAPGTAATIVGWGGNPGGSSPYSSRELLLLLSHFSHVRLFMTPWTAAHQAPPSMGFSRQECCSGLPLPSPHLQEGPPQMTHPMRALPYAQMGALAFM